jgi:hypothetical protein
MKRLSKQAVFGIDALQHLNIGLIRMFFEFGSSDFTTMQSAKEKFYKPRT